MTEGRERVHGRARDERHQITVGKRQRRIGSLGAQPTGETMTGRIRPKQIVQPAVWRAVQSNIDIWLLDGTRMSRVTFDAAPDRFPIWSPDGRRIVFDAARKGPRDLFQKASSESPERRIGRLFLAR